MKKIRLLLKHLFIPHRSNAFRPHAVRHKALSIYTFGLILSQLLLGVTTVSGPDLSLGQSRVMEENILTLTNTERIQAGLADMVKNDALAQAAERKLADMLEKGYWDHTGPNGETAWDFITASGYIYQLAGENLARGFDSSQEAVNAWMASPTHKENILNSRFTETGIAVGSGRVKGTVNTYIVQLFGEPKTAFASAKEVRGELTPTKEILPDIKLANATTEAKTPYFILWTVLFMLMVIDGVMIRKLGLHASRSHVFNFRVSLLTATVGLAILLVGFAGIA